MSSPIKKPPAPHIPKALLEWLKDKFPDKCPRITDTTREVWCNVGKAEVVRHLEWLYNQQGSA